MCYCVYWYTITIECIGSYWNLLHLIYLNVNEISFGFLQEHNIFQAYDESSSSTYHGQK